MDLSSDWNAEELGHYLGEMGIHEDVVANIINNRVSVKLFLELSEDDLKELVLTVGDRITLRKVLKGARKVKCYSPSCLEYKPHFLKAMQVAELQVITGGEKRGGQKKNSIVGVE